MSRPHLARHLTVGLALALVLALLLWFVVGWIAADRLTVPTRHFDPDLDPVSFGGEFDDVALTSADGIDLAAWHLPVPGADAGVVLVHGRNSSRTREFDGRFAELGVALQAEGYHVVMLDLRGHGVSGEGRFTFGRFERLDVLAAVDHLEALGVPPGQVGVLGVSMGAASVIGAAAEDARIGGLWADAGYANIAPVIRAEWPEASGLPLVFWHAARLAHRIRFGFDLAASRPAGELPFVAPRPIQLVHGTADRLVPFEHALALRSAEPSAQLWVLEGVGHADAYGAEPEVYARRVVAFFDVALRIRTATIR
jgi:uncharacterized protein